MLVYCFAQYSTLLFKKFIFTIHSSLAKLYRELVFFTSSRDLCYSYKSTCYRNKTHFLLIIKRTCPYALTLLFCLTKTHQSNSQNFENQTSELGVDHSYSDSTFGAGLSCVDFNLDGLDDITIPSKDSIIFFYQNTGEEFIQLSLLDQEFGEVKSLCWIDFDNDSDLDLSFTEYQGSFFLFENTGNLELVDITENSLMTNDACENFGHSWIDINGDGLLDVYINRYYSGQFCLDENTENLLFVNNGDNTFTEKAAEYGISDGDKMSFQSSFYDYNKDGLIDLHVINDRFYENSLYRNTGLGYFEDVSIQTNTNLIEDAMTNTIFDYNYDGYQDIFFTNTNNEGSHLLAYNPEDQLYEDLFPNSGAESYIFNWGATSLDYDNDRLLDLAIASGTNFGNGYLNLLFRNNGSVFYPVVNNFDQDSSATYGVAKGDFNSDGYYDLTFLNEAPNTSKVYVNTTTNNNKWLKVNFSGSCNNQFGIGVQYEYFINGFPTVSTVFAGTNYLAQDSYTHIIGLGNENVIDSLLIQWPTGLIEKHYNLSPFLTHSFEEGQTFDVTLDILSDSLFICLGEEIELSTSIEYLNTTWNDGLSSDSLIINSPGEYFAILEIEPNINICSDTVFVTLKEDLIINSVETQNPSCFGLSDGTTALNHLDISSNEIISNFSDLGDGLNTLTISDDYYCPVSIAVELFAPAPIYSYAEYIKLPCDSNDLGEIEIFTLGGTAPYSYSLEDLNTIPYGQNTITTEDENECTFTFDFFLELSPIVNIEFEVTHQIESTPGNIEILNGSDVNIIDIINEEGLSQDPENLTAGTYIINFSDENGCVYSEEFIIETLTTTGNSLLKGSLELYPNPCEKLLNVNNVHSSFSISVYSADGKELLTKNVNPETTNSINLESLKEGFYFVQIKKGLETITRTIIKI